MTIIEEIIVTGIGLFIIGFIALGGALIVTLIEGDQGDDIEW